MHGSAKMPLSDLEISTLLQIRLTARIDPDMKDAARRLVELGLVTETDKGFTVTPEGLARAREEGKRTGLH